MLERLARSTTELQIHTAEYFCFQKHENEKKLNEISCDKKAWMKKKTFSRVCVLSVFFSFLVVLQSRCDRPSE